MKQKNVVVITGGLGFIGSFFSQSLIENNYKVIIIDNSLPKTVIQKKLLKKCFMYENLDITNENEIKFFKQKLKTKKIFVNCLINNAAIDSVPKITQKKSHLPNLDVWNKEIEVSLTGSYLMIKYFGEEMKKKKQGKIINIGSDLSMIAPNQELYSEYKNFLKPVTYSVIKHGLLGLTKYFASLYAKKNVQVNMLSPGPVFNKQKKTFIKKLLMFIPMKRMANKNDLNQSLLFLLDKNNCYMTGQNIIVDGGRTII